MPLISFMMNPFIQIAHGVIGALIISLFLILRSGFGEARHTFSLIGAVAIFIASGYILRTRLIRWGSRQVWLKYHQRLASLGLCLVLIHSALHPLAWHSWLTFSLALLNLGTGVAVSLTARRTRRILLRSHLALAPILLTSIILHGREKLDHDEFFPLTQEHDIPCVRCHTTPPLLFSMDVAFQTDLDKGNRLPEDLQWEFESRQISLSQDITVSIRKKDSKWLITDAKNKQTYHVRKDEGQLHIYADSTYKTHTCRTCHVHNTPEIQHAHEIHGVSPYHRCLNCHQTIIHGKKYGAQRVHWDYDPNW
ncbi:hypothetical protein HYR99_35135 [Candidatus Poribacteria bacterium]|nr:hypothetical protein [Candidatus Poribacteria bacterium]